MNAKIKEFRQEIAKLEKEQKELKPQRKTVNRPENAGEVNPYTAAYNVRKNKEELRIMYAAYGLMRGKKFSEIENKAKPLNHDEFYTRTGIWVGNNLVGKHPLVLYLREINEYLEKYGYKIEYEEKENRWGQKIKDFNIEACETAICTCEQQA